MNKSYLIIGGFGLISLFIFINSCEYTHHGCDTPFGISKWHVTITITKDDLCEQNGVVAYGEILIINPDSNNLATIRSKD